MEGDPYVEGIPRSLTYTFKQDLWQIWSSVLSRNLHYHHFEMFSHKKRNKNKMTWTLEDVLECLSGSLVVLRSLMRLRLWGDADALERPWWRFGG
jgi:hypothetical protein